MSKILAAVSKGTPPVLKGYTIFTDAFQQMIKQRNALIKDDWNNLITLANRGLGNAYGTYREICRNIGVLQSQSDEANEALGSFLKFHAINKETRKEFYSEVKKELLKTNPEISKDRLKAIDALGEGNFVDNVILNGLKKRQTESSDMIESAIEATVALATRSVMALTYAAFDSHYKQISQYPLIAHKDNLIPYIQKEIKQFENELEGCIKMLHTAIIKRRSPQRYCENIFRVFEQSLPTFGRLQATIRHFVLALENNKSAGIAEKVGKMAANAGDLTRAAFASYAGAYYLSLQSQALNKSQRIKVLLEPEANLKYDIKFPDGKDTEVSKVDKAKNGDFIEVGGFVKSIRTRRQQDKKLISQITLLDASSQKSVEAVGVFVHFRHVGLQEGAFCCLSGKWQSKSKINALKPAIEIEQLSIDKLSKKSWKIRFQDIGDKFFDRWPGGLNIRHGLSPHISGGKEGKSDVLGAGELIFRPFIRS